MWHRSAQLYWNEPWSLADVKLGTFHLWIIWQVQEKSTSGLLADRNDNYSVLRQYFSKWIRTTPKEWGGGSMMQYVSGSLCLSWCVCEVRKGHCWEGCEWIWRCKSNFYIPNVPFFYFWINIVPPTDALLFLWNHSRMSCLDHRKPLTLPHLLTAGFWQ